MAPGRNLAIALDMLRHAKYCDQNCGARNCQKMKSLLSHLKRCSLKLSASCKNCKEMIAIVVQHAKICENPFCEIQFCAAIKKRIAIDKANKAKNEPPKKVPFPMLSFSTKQPTTPKEMTPADAVNLASIPLPPDHMPVDYNHPSKRRRLSHFTACDEHKEKKISPQRVIPKRRYSLYYAPI